jgi:hypothetical protein
MKYQPSYKSALAVVILLALAATLPATAQTANAAIDAGLYTSYFFGAGYTSVTWIVCGSTQQSEGCYDSGSLGTFGKIGAMLEGNPAVNLKTNTVTRSIYVIDIAGGSTGTDVMLYAYKKVDVITSSFDNTTVTLSHVVTLPLTGGSKATCSMAANNGYLFIGTNKSAQAVEVQKTNLAVTTIGGFSPPINVTSITADKYGYVTVTFGGFISGENGFVQFGPTGQSVGDGGGAWFMLNTQTALSTAGLPSSSAEPANALEVRAKKPEPGAATQ